MSGKKIISLINEIGNIGNRPDIRDWKNRITEEAESLLEEIDFLNEVIDELRAELRK